MHETSEILINLALMFPLALIFGLATQRLGLSPIVGYLLTGIFLGPQTPGFVADHATASQFAEIGVILLMFGVGLHFHFKDLLAVRRIAIPGAVVQILVAAILGLLAALCFKHTLGAGIVTGIAVSVASTVVLVRVLMDSDVLQASQGRIAVGWLIVEDIFTVLVLVVLPSLATMLNAQGTFSSALIPLLKAFGKLGLFGLAIYFVGLRGIPRLLTLVARTRSRELFVLAILAIALAVAIGSATIFGVSIALGAFLAGVIVGQSDVSHQAAADALPMRDAFAVLFFVSVGMLFDPVMLFNNFGLFSALMGVILIGKPLAALGIVWFLGYSLRTGLTVAIGLAQIGEFSFILAELALKEKLLSEEIYSALVACSLVSIAINPLIFRTIAPLEIWLHKKLNLSARAEKRAREKAIPLPAEPFSAEKPHAVIVGYGPVGETVATMLKKFGVTPVVIDLNVDTVRTLTDRNEMAVFGDASNQAILEAAGIQKAKYLLISNPDLLTRMLIVMGARELNSDLKIFVRARYIKERAWMEEVGVTAACYEEVQAAIGLTELLLRELGVKEERIQLELKQNISLRNNFA